MNDLFYNTYVLKKYAYNWRNPNNFISPYNISTSFFQIHLKSSIVIRLKTNLNKIKAYQNITLRKITNAPSYIYEYTYNDMHINTIEEESAVFYKRFFSRLGYLARKPTHPKT